ncbi:MAG: ParB N-terminal domain-containing protein, partial [Thiotrichales bacterium]|nr:ParB N-terminal domain-containing protein [Thiotrichales bacterium]
MSNDFPLPDVRRLKPSVMKELVAESVKEVGSVDIGKVTDRITSKRQLPDLSLLQGASEATHVVPPEPLSAAKMKSSKLADQVAKSLSIANPVTETGMALSAGMPPLGAMNNGMLTLRVPDLDFYDRNPRREQNPRFDEIKASIRESGAATIIFEVTKRPDAKKYMVARGGNTRLRALKELWSETYDPKYEQVTCIFKAWNGDLQTMAAHWLENNLRGDMSFIDQANEIAEMRSEIEAEKGEALSYRAFSDELKRLGVVIGKAAMSYLLFMAEHVSVMGDMAKYVNQFAVKKLQPICNKVVSLGESGEFGVGMREYSVYEEIIDPVFKIWAEQFVIAEQEQTELPDVDDFEKLLVKQIAKTQQME